MSIQYAKEFEVLWVDTDLNGHLTHTAYSNYATNVRVGFFTDCLKHDVLSLLKEGIGPIIIREFIEYKREVHLGDTIKIDLAIVGVSEKGDRWILRHKVYKENKVCCVITIEGAWLDLKTRKLTFPVQKIYDGFNDLVKDSDFKIMDRRSRLSFSF